MTVAIHFVGLLKSPVSWAKAGRELVRALAREGAYVSAVSLKGYLYDEAFPLEAEVEEAVARKRREGWDLALDYPPNFARLDGGRRAGIVIYEADRLPPHWVQAINEHLDLAITPSRFCLEAATASGVERGKIRVVPFGVNGEIYHPKIGTVPIFAEGSQATDSFPQGLAVKGVSVHGVDGKIGTVPIFEGGFRLLTVGAPHVRKGLKETVEAFRMAFGPKDGVGLVIKCPPMGQLGRRPWEYKQVQDFLPGNREGQIAIVEGAVTEQEMAALYRACDVYVQASYGEAFGLAALEAAACGKAVITTNWGAAREIFDEKSAYLVEYDLIEAGPAAYDWPSELEKRDGRAASAPGVNRRAPGGDAEAVARMARPGVADLAAAMRLAREDAALRETKAKGALEAAARFTWRHSAKALMAALE